MEQIIENHRHYSTKYLNRHLFDVDEKIIANKYFIDRKNYFIKSGKYEGVSYHMLTVLYPFTGFTTWFIENGAMEDGQRDLLKLMIKRQRLNRVIETRLKLGQYKSDGFYEFEL